MENKQIKDLMAAMARTGTTKLSIKQKDCEVELERTKEQVVHAVQMPQTTYMPTHRPHEIPASLHPPKEDHPKPTEDAATYITSPMVGTFYASPTPEDSSFVQVGDNVTTDTVVCIVEAMKVMNEIKSDASGTIAEVLVENGHPVEFGTKLFKVK